MTSLREYFCRKSGEEIMIVNNCGHCGIKDRFATVGAVVFFVMIITFLSCWYSFQMLFDNPWLSVPVSFFFAWMVTNIYHVLLTTLTKPVLKIKYQGVIKNLSFILRVAFIIFFALFIAKPLEAWIFETELDARIETMKTVELRSAEQRINQTAQATERPILKAITHDEMLNISPGRIRQLQEELDDCEAAKNEALNRVDYVINHADYFIQRIQLLATSGAYWSSWSFTLMIIFVFLLPVYLKLKINPENPYFQHKREIYERIVLHGINGDFGYIHFKEVYSEIFKNRFDKDVIYHEAYADAPFNTLKKSNQHKYNSEEDFLQLLAK